jgi:hypothetical protein
MNAKDGRPRGAAAAADPGLWHDFVLQPGMLAAADSAVAQAAWFTRSV